MTRRLVRRGGKPWLRADSQRPDDTKKPEVGAGPKKCHGALAPLPNVWRQWRAKRVHCTPGLGGAGAKGSQEFASGCFACECFRAFWPDRCDAPD